MSETEHYFTAKTTTEFKPKKVSVQLAGRDTEVTTAAGIFSPDGLDRGTAVLLKHLPPASSGNILDIGCGWGAISLHSALENPEANVWAIDVNERARMLTELNAKNLQLSNVNVVDPSEMPKDISFTEIRSNPPIRIGKDALHELLNSWLPRLAPGGVCYLVVAKHLGAESLSRWIATAHPVLKVERFARDKGFHIIRAIAS